MPFEKQTHADTFAGYDLTISFDPRDPDERSQAEQLSQAGRQNKPVTYGDHPGLWMVRAWEHSELRREIAIELISIGPDEKGPASDAS